LLICLWELIALPQASGLDFGEGKRREREAKGRGGKGRRQK